MNYFPKLRQRSLLSETQVYNRPLLLADALHQLENLTRKQSSGSNTKKRAGPGRIVDLLELESNKKTSYKLVMPNEAAPRESKISVFSLLGASLLGLKKGDTARVYQSGHNRKFQILDIHHGEQ